MTCSTGSPATWPRTTGRPGSSRQTVEEAKVSARERAAALILMIPCLLGICGLHRIYLGRRGTGILMLILSALGPVLLLASAFAGGLLFPAREALAVLGLAPAVTVVLVIWELADLYRIAAGTMKDAQGRPVIRWRVEP